MPSSRPDFALLIERLRSGDRSALAELYTEYGCVVREAVRRRLPERLRSEYDSLDFAHEVWASVCDLPAGRFNFDTPGELGGFLTRVAYNKVIDVCRSKFQTQAHDVSRERRLVRTEDGGDVAAIDRQPTPSQWVMADEQWSAIAASLPPEHAAVVARLREGYTHEEVAAMAGISDRTVRRIVERVQRFCEAHP